MFSEGICCGHVAKMLPQSTSPGKEGNMEQKKNIEQNKKTGYALYDFMARDMGLSGVALRVYALIYSFTTAGSDCHGSIGYIAKRVDASYKSVQLSLKHLVERGYVTKRQEKPKKPSTYVAVTDVPITDVPITDVPITDYRLPIE